MREEKKKKSEKPTEPQKAKIDTEVCIRNKKCYKKISKPWIDLIVWIKSIATEG